MATARQKDTREHIIKTCRQLFTVRGFANTPVSAVIEATGVKKGNLYYYFTSKEALGLAVLKDAREDFFALLETSCVASDPLERIINSCTVILHQMEKDNFVGGCLFGNAALEMTEGDSRFAEILHSVFKHWLARIEQCLYEAERDTDYRCPVPVSRMAKLVVAAVEGGIMMSRLNRSKNDFQDCILALQSILQVENP
ncbi:MAG: TetR/AcrR family transcriptional regulator [Desulfobulbaceae bacterium]|uniref:TetR/AcrR family transcriptional regulator n=1 Tax=Candidatus Desulfatifera sulfidica TaxID=2841691 RepID=A0A8J6NA37_9BACT|nr:TetR/AcrR family transcriptional regulator [Candidatus Desulfatifera sulfidica]